MITHLRPINSACITTTCRSLVTKCVGPFEVGSVFAVMGAFQAMVPVFSGPIYGLMYKSTITSFPGAFLIFTAGVYVFVAQVLTAVHLVLMEADVKGAAKKDDMGELMRMNSEKPKALLMEEDLGENVGGF